MNASRYALDVAGALLTALAVGLCSRAPAAPAADVWPLAVKPGDIDIVKCQVVRDGERLPVTKPAVLAALGLGPGDGWPAGEPSRARERIAIVYTVGFSRPLPIGTIMAAAVTAMEAEVDGQWQPIGSNTRTVGTRLVATLPVAFAATALRFTQTRRGREPIGLRWLRLYAARLVNVVPAAVANAKSEYTAYYQFSPPTVFAASRITAGSGSWINAGLGPGEDKITSSPISDVTPTWFMLSWETPQALVGLHLESNITAVELYEYTGPDGLNPAVAHEREWRKVRGLQTEFSDHEDGPTERSFRFAEPLTTRGLKLLIEGVVSQNYHETDQVARIDALHAYTDLGAAAVPDLVPRAGPPPFTISYELATAGTMSLAIDAADGTRIRNLLGREWQAAGAQTVAWDLKDAAGRIVGPGTYRWQGITGPRPYLTYEMTAYPNVRNFHPENTPWRNGHSGTGGWLADHGVPTCVATHGDVVYLGSPVCESGESLIGCDLDGKRLWGHGNFAAFTGPSLLAANSHTLYVGTPVKQIPYTTEWREIVFTIDRETQEVDEFLNLQSSHKRQRGMVGLAADDKQVYVAVRGKSEWLINACSADDVDILNCLPRYAEQKKSNQHFVPNPRNEFLRLLRLTGTPPGQNGSLTRLESSDMPARRQHIVVAFKRPVPIGSLVFPFPHGDYVLKFSVLDATAPYPPDPAQDDQWRTFFAVASPGRSESSDPSRGWTVVPAPPTCTTRALRITFDRAEDELDEVFADSALGGSKPWQANMDGLKILRRRYENLFPSARVRVNSGRVTDPASGAWDAERTTPLTAGQPAIYALEWPQPQALRGLAIMEVDGNEIYVEVFDGPGAIDIESQTGWRRVARYQQQRRYFYQPDANRNHEAVYMDGYVDFGETVTTRAVRLRITSQWTVRDEGRAGLYGIREDRGGMALDPSRCHVYGVAPLRPLPDSVPVEPLAAERLEIYDARLGTLLREVPFPAGGKLTLASDGAVYGVSDGKIVKLDLVEGEHQVFTEDPLKPDGLTFDRHGKLYVADRAKDRQNVRVYSAQGAYERSIGKPGGSRVGLWDPEYIGLNERTRVDLAIDDRDQLWIVAAHRNPKRQSVWTLDGRHLRDHLGNTRYGGGGVLNPWDKRQLFYAAENATLEFALDWETGLTSLKAIPWLGDAPGGELPVKIDERLYLCTRPVFGMQGCGIVYRYRDARLHPVAALGRASDYPPLRTPEIEAGLGTRALAEMDFVWSDLNGDERPQLDEVAFQPARFRGVSWFDRELGVQAGSWRFEVTEFLPSGVPIYGSRQLPNVPENDPGVKLGNDQLVFFEGRNYRRPNAGASYGLNGAPGWRYATEGYGVHAITKASDWTPAQVVSEFDIIGFDRAHAGDLGDFFITNSNIGRWNLWTADGLLAGEVMRDRRDPERLPWVMATCERGMPLPGLTPGSEHFSGYFCRTYEDDKYYLVAGHNHISVLEINGLENYRRLAGEVVVTADDVRRIQAWAQGQQAREVYARAPLYHCYPAGRIAIDADLSEWQDLPQVTAGDASFRMAYGSEMLYLAYQTQDLGPFANQGNDWRRMFKSGAAVDLQMAVTGEVRPDNDLAEGDFRLLLTPAKGGPLSVIYQPIAAAAKDAEAWETRTMVFHTAFDRVAKMPQVQFAFAATERGYIVEAAVPLEAIGLTISDDLRLPFDWGVLVTDSGGNAVLQRLYWANKATTILADEAAEAQISPQLWGHVIFHSQRRSQFPGVGVDLLNGAGNRGVSDDDILDELEE